MEEKRECEGVREREDEEGGGGARKRERGWAGHVPVP